MLKNYSQKCDIFLKELEKKKFPEVEGILVISNTTKKPIYYHRTKDPLTGQYNTEYIPNRNVKLISQLGEKRYLFKLNRLVKKRKRQTSHLLKDFHDNEFDNLYLKMHPLKRAFFSPLIPTVEQIRTEWFNKPYQGNFFKENERMIMTRKGKRVRSKTEKILAETFDELGIMYKYECPLELGNRIIYPDFTFMNDKLELVFWEHFGMMDDPTYATHACNKIKQYEKQGIFLGERLIITFEDSKNDLDYEWVDSLIQKHLL